MKFRKRISRGASRRLFRHTASLVHKKNLALASRGGIRL